MGMLLTWHADYEQDGSRRRTRKRTGARLLSKMEQKFTNVPAAKPRRPGHRGAIDHAWPLRQTRLLDPVSSDVAREYQDYAKNAIKQMDSYIQQLGVVIDKLQNTDTLHQDTEQAITSSFKGIH